MAERLESGLHSAVATGHHADAQQGTNLFVGGQHAVAIGDENALARVAVTGRHLHDCLVHCPGGRVDPLQDCDFVTLGDFIRPLLDGVHRVSHHGVERHGVHPATTTRCGGGGCFGCGQQSLFAEVARVRKARGITLHHANSGTTIATTGNLLDLSVIESSRSAALILHEHLGELGPRGLSTCQHSRQHIWFDQQRLVV